ncbi:hypothetical protein N7517_009572 [Penicillium concentricum]|uniref:HAT C-terminal dimerisation domain-containing protein n=1 Tax=Penicillium concentricum TaxID=293559 RepID=A0A9W9RHV4_9EURO|nr:uncharacterized protein N7517_009572 [Penicillium concentricum]KAJ5360381.1 hypothetical protein N7517_009572 [Penicillium concentricum]
MKGHLSSLKNTPIANEFSQEIWEQELLTFLTVARGGISRLDSMVKPKRPRSAVAGDELSQYLDSDIAPLVFWRENAYRFLTLVALARDVLLVPATGAGVERLFNTARDICHYRRGRLSATTIQELMMFLLFLQEFFTRDEIEAAKEEKEITTDTVNVDPISDTEEEQT